MKSKREPEMSFWMVLYGKNIDLTGFSFRYDGCLCIEHIGDNLKLSNTVLCALQFIISGKISKLFSFSLKEEYMGS